jgi:hypothetical protein
MLKRALASLASCAAIVVAIGCGDDNSTVCTPIAYANAGPLVPASGECEAAGGTCSTACPVGYHEAPSGSTYENACAVPYDPGPSNGCTGGPPAAGAGYAGQFCCLPDADGGADASTDSPSDARGDASDASDAAPRNGTCGGSFCQAGCSCELLPQTGAPYCLCVDAGTAEASTPNCGTIWCFSGCTCEDPAASACACP